MVHFAVKINPQYAEACFTAVGVTEDLEHFFLLETNENNLKFPGTRVFATDRDHPTLDEVVAERFEEQVGLRPTASLGLRAIMPTRSRDHTSWMLNNVFFYLVDPKQARKDTKRRVYLAATDSFYHPEKKPFSFDNPKNDRKLWWTKPDYEVVAQLVADFIFARRQGVEYLRRIPVVGVPSEEDLPRGWHATGQAVASMIPTYRKPGIDTHVIMLQRRGDEFPGYAGGKIETPRPRTDGIELTGIPDGICPVSACIKEGEEEFGFRISPRGLLCVSTTPLEMPEKHGHHNMIVNYCFVAEPLTTSEVDYALTHPEKHLEGKMERYVIETIAEHRTRLKAGGIRMPDMVLNGLQFLNTSPGQLIPLTQFIQSGVL